MRAKNIEVEIGVLLEKKWSLRALWNHRLRVGMFRHGGKPSGTTLIMSKVLGD